MKAAKLTAIPPGATSPAMGRAGKRGRMRFGRMWPACACVVLAGCISLEAPDEPIVIELNINIRQEVVYMLAEDAAETIEENAEIF